MHRRSLVLVALFGCSDVDPGWGACEMRYTQIDGHPEPIRFCTIQDDATCAWVQGSHGDSDLGYAAATDCEDAGFPVCCRTSTVPVCFEDPEEADVARLAIGGEPCR